MKKLDVLYERYDACRACALGTTRELRNAPLVRGAGAYPRGIVIVNEAPTWKEEEEGTPVAGDKGDLLFGILHKLGMQDYTYITNTLVCRSCEPYILPTGEVKMTAGYKGRPPQPVYRDMQPTAPQKVACKARLMEELYILDPLLIIALGSEVADVLTGKGGDMYKQHGDIGVVEVPGITHVPALTPKGAWIRKVKGKLHLPTERRVLRYALMYTFNLATVLRYKEDKAENSIPRLFAKDLAKARDMWNWYRTVVQEEK